MCVYIFLADPVYVYIYIYIIPVIKSRRMIQTGHVAHMGGRRSINRLLVGNPEVQRSLGRNRRRCEDDNKMDTLEIGWGGGLNCAGPE